MAGSGKDERGVYVRQIVAMAACVLVLASLQGCATPRLELVSGMVTTGGELKFEEIPLDDVPLRNRVYVLTHVRWSPATDEGGRHEVQWLWYSGDHLVHAGKKTLHFRRTPYRLYSSLPAAGLGLGHYRVTVVIDGKLIDTQEFNIIP
jgi:hypothetical protein